VTVSSRSEQLNIPFDAANPFPEALRNGRFTVFLEYATPKSSQPFDSAVAVGRRIARVAADRSAVDGVFTTQPVGPEPTHDMVETARILCEASGKPCVLCVPGRELDAERLTETTARALSYGVRTVLAVSGDGVGRPSSGRRRRHMDSVEILGFLRSARRELFCGAAVNPYKYTVADSYLQYFKMVRKIQTGAAFLVAQAGWDMAKLHELQWYLQSRELSTPVLARLHVLSPEESALLADGLAPGVHVSREFAAMVEREYTLSRNQFLATQLRRVALQAVGCAVLGYSGIVLSGIRDEETAVMVLDHVEEALAEKCAYPQWVEAWNAFHDGVTFSPHAGAFYCFSNLLDPEVQLYDPEHCRSAGAAFPEAARLDLFRSAVVEGLLAARRVPDAVRGALLRLAGAGDFSEDEVRACAGLSPAGCPKGLPWGACGGSFPDGACEFGESVCFHWRVLAVRAKQRKLDLLETAPSHPGDHD